MFPLLACAFVLILPAADSRIAGEERETPVSERERDSTTPEEALALPFATLPAIIRQDEGDSCAQPDVPVMAENSDRKMDSPPSLCANLDHSPWEWQMIAFRLEDLRKVGEWTRARESSGTVDGLTAWDERETFASPGIGQFLRFPEEVVAIFAEDFLPFLEFDLSKEPTPDIPKWQRRPKENGGWIPCPWKQRPEFIAVFRPCRMVAPLAFLLSIVPTKAEFLVERFNRALPKHLAAAGSAAEVIGRLSRQLPENPESAFAMTDQAALKGEGTKPEERYKGEASGLQQVLSAARETAIASSGQLAAFARTANEAQTNRTSGNPPDLRCLMGWRDRVSR